MRNLLPHSYGFFVTHLLIFIVLVKYSFHKKIDWLIWQSMNSTFCTTRIFSFLFWPIWRSIIRPMLFHLWHRLSVRCFSTAAAHLAQHFFDTNQLDSFFLNVNDVTLPSLHRFTHVKSLYLFSSSLSPLDLLQSIVCLHHIESLDVLNILRCSSDELDMLIDSACRLNKLKMKFDRSFRIPSQISSLILDNNDRLIPSDILSHQISSVRTLQIEVKSKEMIIDIIDRLDHLDSIVLWFDDVRLLWMLRIRPWMERLLVKFWRMLGSNKIRGVLGKQLYQTGCNGTLFAHLFLCSDSRYVYLIERDLEEKEILISHTLPMEARTHRLRTVRLRHYFHWHARFD